VVVTITFDPAKSAKNERERGLSFAVVAEIDFATAQTIEDTRRAYPERRFVLTGYLGEVLLVCCYTPIAGGLRVISLRRANARERRRHAEEAARLD
jgi:hypothetical protein